MIIDVNKNPRESIFYLAAYILKYAEKMKWYTIEELYAVVYMQEKLKFKIFIYCLDFLYLCGVVEYSIEKQRPVYRIINPNVKKKGKQNEKAN